ncbi:MAG: hypothetical protein IKG18_03900 [Atopobiaceae bacterium]|nr:hypothetical protein [Atopobiaceae bacterium]
MPIRLKKLLSLFLSIALVLPAAMPAAAIAEERSVELDNHSLATDQTTTITAIRIDDVDKPQPGKQLDDTATVTSAEGATWDIATLWVSDELSVTTMAEEGHTYLPVLAFFVPQGYALEGSGFTVTLSDSLTKLFGTSDIISVYNAQHGITYILPATLRNLFAQSTPANASSSDANEAASASVAEAATAEAVASPASPSLVELYCAQTAREKLSDSDLEWLIDLVLNHLQPQAVELLLNKFPAFTEASANDELGTSIGMYIYFKTGDDDGLSEHQGAAEALAYVQAMVKKVEDQLKYCNMIGINASELVASDEKGNPETDLATGKFTLARSGKDFITFQNTIVHEMFHAFMDDYNRTGMCGAIRLDTAARLADDTYTTDDLRTYQMLHYPLWFIEGTASCMENNYEYRYETFEKLRMKDGKPLDLVDAKTLFTNFMTATDSDNKLMFFPLAYWQGGTTKVDGEEIEIQPWNARYVSGYLATLYLSELAYQKASKGDSAKSLDANNQPVFSADKIRMGLNYILREMHEGKALDNVIKEISTDKNGTCNYDSTDSFETKFVMGEMIEKNGKQGFGGDPKSIEFVVDFLNYMTAIEKKLPKGAKPNGSILFDFEEDFASPLDPSKRTASSFYRIIDSNELTPSSVKNDETRIGAGKTSIDLRDILQQLLNDLNSMADDETLPQAAKASAKTPSTTATTAASAAKKSTTPVASKPAATAPATKKEKATATAKKPSATDTTTATAPQGQGQSGTATDSAATQTMKATAAAKTPAAKATEEQKSAAATESANEESTTAQDPAATETEQSKESVVTEPATNEEPATTAEPSAADKPTAAEEPAPTEQPAATEPVSSEDATPQEPATTTEPTTTEQPAATEPLSSEDATPQEPAAEESVFTDTIATEPAPTQEPVAPEPAAPEAPDANPTE